METTLSRPKVIRTPDQRLRVFISSTLEELKAERLAAKEAIGNLHLTPVMFEFGARPHPPRDLYRAYLEQSHVFIGIYGDRYGWIVPGMEISGLEDEFQLSANHPRLIYIKRPAPQRDERLAQLIGSIMDAGISCKFFSYASELSGMIQEDLAVLLSESFENGRTTTRSRSEHAAVPATCTAVIGRSEEIATIKDLLRQNDTRVITLTGTGGIGKTSLAMAIAHEMKEEFADGVFFVPLASISDAAVVLPTVVQQIFPGELGGQPPLELLTQLFQGKHALLVLDNFEQVIDAAPSVADLSKACPGLKILITSREVLRLSGEHEFRVPMLGLPDMFDYDKLSEDLKEQAATSSAVQLFVQRAKAIDRTFELTTQNAPAIAEICIRLDGLPLAIELVAARIRVLTPQAMLQHLGKSHLLLTNGRRDMPERHRTLMATIHWSYSMLSAEEQRVLRALSIFSGGCTLGSAFVVAGNGPLPLNEWPRIAMYLSDPNIIQEPYHEFSLDFLEVMESLSAKNLVNSVERSGENRFLLYATVKDFARQHLALDPVAEGVARNHFHYFLDLAEKLWPSLRGNDASSSFEQLDAELDNMREALTWSLQHEPVLGLRLVVALGEYWDTRGMPEEQIHWSNAFLQKISSGMYDASPTLIALAKMELVRPAFRTGDLAKCIEMADEVEAIAKHLNNEHLYLDSLMPRGMVAAYNMELANMGTVMDEGLTISRRLRYEMATIEFLLNSAAASNFAGEFPRSIDYCNEALELAERQGATRWKAISLSIRGFAQMNLGKIEDAVGSFNGSLQCSKHVMDNVLVIYPLVGKAQIALTRGEIEKAAKLIGAVERFCERKGTAVVPVVRHMIAMTQDAVRTQVGEDEYRRMYEMGRQLQLNEAIGMAEGLRSEEEANTGGFL